MDTPLRELANSCVDYAAALDIFLENTGREPAIRDSIEDLMSLSKVLYALHSGISHPTFGRNIALVNHDLELALRSLRLSFDDIQKMLAGVRFTPADGRVPYRALWDSMNHHLTQSEGINMPSRLDRYNKFLEGLMAILKSKMPVGDMLVLRERLERLLNLQLLSAEPGARGFPQDQRAPPVRAQTPSMPKNPPMYRPPLNHFQTYPAANMTPPPFDNTSPIGRGPQSPGSTGSLNSWDFMPTFASDVPQSPVYSDSSQQTWGSNSNSSNEYLHWAPRLMNGRHPRTKFRSAGQPTMCDGREDPTAFQRLVKDGFVEVFKCSFPDTKSSVKLYWRKDDHRCRILFGNRDSRTGRTYLYCMPMVSLKLIRSDNCLSLWRLDMEKKNLQRWANLNFTDYERMTLFQCTYQCMKRQDSKIVPEQLLDWPFPSEEMEYAAEIRDDSFRHDLRILRDTDSGCVRLEASALRGQMKGVPIWTAFVTDFVGSRTWMRRLSPNIVQLRQLQPYIFCNNYTPSGQFDSGAFQLSFTQEKDAAAFMARFHQIY